MSLDIESIRKKQKEMLQGKGDGYKFKSGKNRIRIFPFDHKVTKDDVKADLFEKQDIGKTKSKVERAVTVHFIGPKSRPVLSNSEILGEFEKQNPDWRRKMKKNQTKPPAGAPSDKYLINIVDTDERPYKVRYAMVPPTVVKSVFDAILDEDYGEKVLGAKGRDFIFKYTPDAAPVDMYKFLGFRDKENCVDLSDLEDGVADFFSEEGFGKSGILLNVDETEKEDEDEADSDNDDEEEDETEEDNEDDADGSEDDDSDDEEDDTDSDDDSDEDDDDEDEPVKKPKKGKGKK